LPDRAAKTCFPATRCDLSQPRLSLILCSRNDSYLGNSRWRLQTTLNYTSARIEELGSAADVEIVVADWGSEVPLSSVMALLPAADSITRFVWIPPALARELQGDSPFPEVLALNAAARRARGAFIGRIDQDTLVGGEFLRRFLAWTDSDQSTEARLDEALLFANRRSIPYRLAVACPPLEVISRFVQLFGPRLRVERDSRQAFYRFDVGVWLLHRKLWEESGGYDERMIYMNDMEIDMIARLMAKYPMVDLGERVGFDFYHLDHYHPGGSRSSSTHRMVNLQKPREPRGMNPNGVTWGLSAYDVPVTASALGAGVPRKRGALGAALSFWSSVALASLSMVADYLYYQVVRRWVRRGVKAVRLYSARPVGQWPGVTVDIWRKLFAPVSAKTK